MSATKMCRTVVLVLLCMGMLCACAVRGENAPTGAPVQPTVAPSAPVEETSAPTEDPAASETPAATPAPEAWQPAFPHIVDAAVVAELCEELSVRDTVTDPAICSEVYSQHAIAYRCDNGKFYVRYDDELKHIAAFYLKENEVDGYPVRSAAAFDEGWLFYTETIAAEEIPWHAKFIEGHAELESARLVYVLDARGEIVCAYAVPYTEEMREQAVSDPAGFGGCIMAYVDEDESVLFDPETGKVVDTGRYDAYDLIAVNDDVALYEKSAGDGERRVGILDRAGEKLGEVTVSDWLGIGAAEDGSIYLTRTVADETDFNLDDYSYPISFLNEEYEFEEKVAKNAVYDAVKEKLAASAEGDVRYHINALHVKVLSEEQARVLCCVTVFEGDEILSVDTYVLVDIAF